MYRRHRRRIERQLARRSAGAGYRFHDTALGLAGVFFLLGLLIALKQVLGG
jgi:hypothetical protein